MTNGYPFFLWKPCSRIDNKIYVHHAADTDQVDVQEMADKYDEANQDVNKT